MIATGFRHAYGGGGVSHRPVVSGPFNHALTLEAVLSDPELRRDLKVCVGGQWFDVALTPTERPWWDEAAA